jgi:hypothetical protein
LFETFKNGIASGHTLEFVEVHCKSQIPLEAQTYSVQIESNDGNVCFGTILSPTCACRKEYDRT